MEPLFTNKCIYTKSKIIEVGKRTSSRQLKAIIFFCIGLIFFLVGILTENYIDCLFGACFCFLYPLLLLWVERSSLENRYQQLLQLYHGEAETVTSFYEDHLVEHYLHGGADITVAYPQVAKVFETKNMFFLMLSTRVGFMLDKQGFDGTTAEEFSKFIRTQAVGEGQIDLKKRRRKSVLITTMVLAIFIAAVFGIAFFEQAIKNIIPKTFTYDNYSIKLTSAFGGYEGKWDNTEATVYCSSETGEYLKENGLEFDSADAYLKDMNESDGIDCVVTAISDNKVWAEFSNTSEGKEYYNYDYVIEKDGDFWFTEFYCLADDADKYKPLFKKWAKTIKISLRQ